MRECIEQLRAGWYGNAEWRAWKAAGKPIGTDPGGQVIDGVELTEQQRINRATERFGRKGKDITANDWIPDDCHRPVNCQGLVDTVAREANKMISNITGLHGDIHNLTWDDDAVFVSDHTRWQKPVTEWTDDARDLSDLTGAKSTLLQGNDAVAENSSTDTLTTVAPPNLAGLAGSCEECDRCGVVCDYEEMDQDGDMYVCMDCAKNL